MSIEALPVYDEAPAELFGAQEYTHPAEAPKELVEGATLIGGGGGVAAVAPGFVRSVKGEITCIVGTADSGSKTGDLRDIFMTPAVGDLRRVTAALAKKPEAGELFDARLDKEGRVELKDGENKKLVPLGEAVSLMQGLLESDQPAAQELVAGIVTIAERVANERGSLQGHTFGNLALTYGIASREDGGLGMGLGKTVEHMSRGLGVEDRVTIMPSSEDPHHLRLQDGNVVYASEDVADEAVILDPANAQVTLRHIMEGQDEVKPYGPALQAVATRKRNVIVPSSAFTSIAPSALLLAESLSSRDGLVVAANLTVDRDTAGFTFPEYLQKLGEFAGRYADFVIVNGETNRLPEGKVPFKVDSQQVEETLGITVVTAALLADQAPEHSGLDPLAAKQLRSLVQTCGERLAAAVLMLEA